MIKILEIAWLIITLLTVGVASYQLIEDGIQSALWMFIVSAVAFTMYMIRKKQRIRLDQQNQNKDDANHYH